MAVNNFPLSQFTQLTVDEVFKNLDSSSSGLSEEKALENITLYGINSLQEKKLNPVSVFFRQFKSNPLISVLMVATVISFFLNQQINSYAILAMIFLSVFLGTWNEYFAEKIIEGLLKKITRTAFVLRNNVKKEIPVAKVTVGDIVFLVPGDIIPADIRFIQTDDIEIDESVLTGESATVFKKAEEITNSTPDSGVNANIGFMGTVVINGFAKGVVLRVGLMTEYGKIAHEVSCLKPETDFQKGLNKLGKLIVKVIFVLSIGIFSINALLGHPILDSLLFSLAIAVGLTPELLPIIVTVSLSFGAGKLAKKHVVIKQLISIENLGNMDILCTDKTGTLTEGKVKVMRFFDINKADNFDVFKLALICNNAVMGHKRVGNTIDISLWEYALEHAMARDTKVVKIYEEPFSYDHQTEFVVARIKGKSRLIAKGSPEAILLRSKPSVQGEKIKNIFSTFSNQGYRMIAVASKPIDFRNSYNWDDVSQLEFHGFITFSDVPKKTAREALLRLRSLGVAIKIITGDNELVTKRIASEVGMEVSGVLLGSEIEMMGKEELVKKTEAANIIARVTPEQKLTILTALRNGGHTVGFMGDGINDIPSLHGADVGITVNTAIDVAKESASVVLLRQSLNVIADGIIEGRKTFANTIKYILMGTSSNFGNMFSAAVASFFLPFLPMTPGQILLTNGLYDISQMSIPADSVDSESLRKPKHWNINFIKDYMIFFGPISSLYDFLTFGIMFYVFSAHDSLFQTGWFIESLATEILVVFVIRTSRKPFYRSKPSLGLTVTCITIVILGILIPFSPFGQIFGFTTPPPLYFLILILLVGTYILLVEKMKSKFLEKYKA